MIINITPDKYMEKEALYHIPEKTSTGIVTEMSDLQVKCTHNLISRTLDKEVN